MKLTYDGHGLNRDDEYATRVITWAHTSKENGWNYVLSNKERETLGPILAAAPDLVEALKGLLPYVNGDIGKSGIKALDKAEAALAKAEGK